MTEFDEAFRDLQAEYLSEVPGRLAELRQGITALGDGEPDASVALTSGFHRLAGSGGSYGFPEISAVAREAEQFIRTEPPWNAESLERLTLAVDRLANAIATQAALLGQPGAAASRGARFCTHVVGHPGESRDMVAELLSSAGLEAMTVGGSPAEVSEQRQREPFEWPDLMVITDDAAGHGDIDPFLVAAAWSDPRAVRPRSIVLVREPPPVGAAPELIPGVDVTLSPSAARVELAAYASAVARVGSPPFRMLVVESDLDQAQLVTGWLETVATRIVHAGTAAAAEPIWQSGGVDVVVVAATLPDADGAAVARQIRDRWPGPHLPIVLLADESAPSDRLEALRAAGDAVLRKPLEDRQGAFLHLVIASAERGRQLRKLAYRDSLTGLLNHSTLLVALEHAMALAKRRGMAAALCTVSLHDLASLNARYGPVAGDRILVHAASVLRGAARGGDLIGRVSGPTFGVVALLDRAEEAGALARRILAEFEAHPAQAPDGNSTMLRTGIGIACDPAAASALAVMDGALQALERAKARGAPGVEHASPGGI